MMARTRRFRNDPIAFFLSHAGFAEQRGQQHPGPFAATGLAVGFLDCSETIVQVPWPGTVSVALDKMNPGRKENASVPRL
jgi:hypothetical protein